MRARVGVLFLSILVVMVFITVRASLQCNVWSVPKEVVGDPWFQATLVDAYCGFLTFFAWVAYREESLAAKVGWFLAIMGLGNMAMAAYVLWQLVRLPAGANVEALLLRPNRAEE
jgi:hypothetical protein